jgi:hypothetical protein
MASDVVSQVQVEAEAPKRRGRPPGKKNAEAVESASPASEALPLWRVELMCPTPLAAKVMEIPAIGEDEARKAYEAANGICGSVHPWVIQRVE